MTKRAIWIFDKNYALLTYLSVRSFVEQTDIQVTLFYCAEEKDPIIDDLFKNLNKRIEIQLFNPDVDQWEPHQRFHIVNRLGRFYALSLYVKELVFLIDSDLIFSPKLKERINEIQIPKSSQLGNKPFIGGVVEYNSVRDAFLFFNKRDKRGDRIGVSPSVQHSTYHQLFGPTWEKLVTHFEYNNGFLIFFQAKALIEEWKKLYLKGIELPWVNPADDQVPLAIAMQTVDCYKVKLDPAWNSFGKKTGNFIGFHVWAGYWKDDLYKLITNGQLASDFSKIVKPYLNDLPNNWIKDFIKQMERPPYYYKKIKGFFEFQGIYKDMVDQFSSGHFVEVGTYKGKSACFMGELIKNMGKTIRFDTIDHFQRADTSLQETQSNLSKAGLENYVNIIARPSLEACQYYATNSLDFVFLDIDSDVTTFRRELEAWYARLKKGGILSGFDYSIHDTVHQNYYCAIDEFCKEKKIPLKTFEMKFLVQKPTNSDHIK